MEQIIKLNIGGKLFYTSKSTLFSKGENFFSLLLEGKIPSIKDENGAYFIDRNGDYFTPLLDFLRTGELDTKTDSMYKIIAREADFYQIKIPQHQATNQVEYLTLSLALLSNAYGQQQMTCTILPKHYSEVEESICVEMAQRKLFRSEAENFALNEIGKLGWKLKSKKGDPNKGLCIYIFKKN